jgi:serine/threonine-protein kinase
MHDESSHRWARIDELLAAALTRPPDERHAFVREACAGDVVLEREVSSMLASLTNAEAAIGESVGAWLDISGPLVDAPDSALPEGTMVGAYRLRRLLGRGGMGNVYAAVRADGTVAREVALKIGRAGTHAGARAQRLRQEQRLLSALEHPHIARLYDTGVTPAGVPFLVMELVQGTRIDGHMDAARLPIPERLRLFEEVCEAVAFAHQRLIVHRDLKPANIFVASDGHVRLLDFGIARLLASDPGDEHADDVATRPGQLVLTPEYAAPEQARGEPASMSMDVYALGVILHELLTGARPAWQRLAMTSADDAIIERAMVLPSRSASDPTVARALRGDLDQVILKALAPDRSTRYPSVEALRDDVRRARQGFPVLARQVSTIERVTRLARRNPVLAAAWGIVAVVSLAFVANIFVQGRRVAAERDRANAERDRAAVERDRANVQRDRARATTRVLATIFERADPFAPGRGDTLRVTQVLAEGIERVNRDLADQPAARAELLSALGRAYLGLGRYDEAQALLDTARALQARDSSVAPDERAATLTALGNLARARGRVDAADSLHAQSLALRTVPSPTGVTAPSVPTSPDARAGRIAPERNEESASAPAAGADRGREAPPLRDDADAERGAYAIALTNVGAGHMERNRFDSARVYYDSAVAVLRTQASPDSGRLAEVLNNRATLAMRMNDFPLAARLAGDAYRINFARLGPEHPRVVGEQANLGFLLDRTGRSAEAEPLLRDALRALRERMPPEHPLVRSAKLTLGGILSRTGRLDEAERLIGEVVAVERAAGNDARLGLPITLDNYAGVLEKLDRLREAQAVYREAYEVARTASGEASPGAAIMLAKVADIGCRLDGASDATLADFQRALGALDRLFPAEHPFRLGGRGQYGACLVRAGRRADGERELLAVFDAGRRAPPQAHATARHAGRELLALYTAPADSSRRRLVQARLDSMGVAGSR